MLLVGSGEGGVTLLDSWPPVQEFVVGEGHSVIDGPGCKGSEGMGDGFVVGERRREGTAARASGGGRDEGEEGEVDDVVVTTWGGEGASRGKGREEGWGEETAVEACMGVPMGVGEGA